MSENSSFLPTTAARWLFRGLRLPGLVAVIVLLGLVAAGFAGTQAATGGVPNPDRPPPPPPPPAPRYVPPPPPPAPRYVPPPPPPAVVVKPKRTTVPHRPIRRHVKRAKKKSIARLHRKAPITAPFAPPRMQPDALGMALSVGQADSGSSSTGVALALGGTLALSLVLLGLALAPVRRLPRSVQGAVYERREPLLYTAGLIYVATGLSLVIALFMS